jgi:hypothetical protein
MLNFSFRKNKPENKKKEVAAKYVALRLVEIIII